MSVIYEHAGSTSIKHSLLIHQVSAVCSWDSSIHDSVHLNRVTSPNERIYLIIKATVQLSHPASMELVLRKRVAVNIYNKQVNKSRIGQLTAWTQCVILMINIVFICFLQSFTQSLKRRMSLKNTLYSCGVTYEIVSNIPKVQIWFSAIICYSITTSNENNFLNILQTISVGVDVSSLFILGLRRARGEGNLGPHGCSWWQWGDPGWRNLHREIYTWSFGSGEHPQSGEVTAGISWSSIFSRIP